MKYLTLLTVWALASCAAPPSYQQPASWATEETRRRYDVPRQDLRGLNLLLWPLGAWGVL